MDTLPTFTPEQLGSSVFTLAALVAFVVQFIKRQLEREGRKLPALVTVLVALAVGETLAALLFYCGYGAKFGDAPPPYTWIIFGAVAATAAAGGRDLLMSLAERNKADAPVVVAPAEPIPPATDTAPVSGARVVIED